MEKPADPKRQGALSLLYVRYEARSGNAHGYEIVLPPQH